jgi:glutaredoxin
MADKHELELFIMRGCPYCVKVEHFMAEHGIEIPLRDVTNDADAAQRLVAVGGKRQTPCLFIDGQALYESDDIIVWLSEHAG